jgi:quinoprotein glucose dehydrogenase
MRPMKKCVFALLVLVLLVGTVVFLVTFSVPSPDWSAYGGNAAGQRYSALTQIDKQNVAQLEQVWRIDGPKGSLQTTPLVIDGILYGAHADGTIFAADAASGKVRWTFSSGLEATQPIRGLSHWGEGDEQRLLVGIMDRLYALDLATGKPLAGFGEGGFVDLRKGIGSDYRDNVTYMTSPGAIYRNLIITGFRTSETYPASPGAIRAYDVRTGALRWTFHSLPRPGEAGAETWPKAALDEGGGANDWAGFAVDEERGIVYAPTGSAVDDFYGSDRLGDNLYADSLVALDAATGKRLWHFQGVHHDVWDRDFPAPPVLLTVKSGGKQVDAVAQTSKQGFVFLFDRMTGKPLFPIEERAVPQSAVPGERTSPTQPFPVLPAPFARQHLDATMLTRRTPEANAWARARFSKFISGGLFTPFGVGAKTVVLPGFDGGAEWGGPAVDPTRGILYVNSNDVAWIGGLTHRSAAHAQDVGKTTYLDQCAACHGLNREGSPPQFPSLVSVGQRLSDQEVGSILKSGRGRMPAFPQLRGAVADALVAYIRTGKESGAGKRELGGGPAPGRTTPYSFTGYNKFLDPDGYPAIAPPWGTLSAIDMNSGQYLWRIPLGQYPELAAKGMKDTGSENYGGPIVTVSGLLFIGATNFDNKLRAFDAGSGHLLWEAQLPYAGNATPATYMADGRQFVVIATSSARNPKGPQGSAWVAFALPKTTGK